MELFDRTWADSVNFVMLIMNRELKKCLKISISSMSTSKFEFIDCPIGTRSKTLCYKAAINCVLQYLCYKAQHSCYKFILCFRIYSGRPFEFISAFYHLEFKINCATNAYQSANKFNLIATYSRYK